MTEEQKVLNLDELFGNVRAVKAKWQGVTYELVRVEALSPKAISRFQSMQKRASQLQMKSLNNDVTDEESTEIVSLINTMLLTLCETMPVESMPFAAKTKLLEFYITETQEKNALNIALAKGKKGKRTGAMSSRG